MVLVLIMDSSQSLISHRAMADFSQTHRTKESGTELINYKGFVYYDENYYENYDEIIMIRIMMRIMLRIMMRIMMRES